MDESLQASIGSILALETPAARSKLVGISGIDGSGKGHVTNQINVYLTAAGFKTAVINIDGWLNLPHIRFDPHDPAGNFYRNAIRFDEMFDQLVLPLREDRSINLTADFTKETAAEYVSTITASTTSTSSFLKGSFSSNAS